MERALGFVVVGCGGIGRLHGDVLHSVEGARLVGVVDVDRSRAAALARDTETAQLGLDEALAHPDVDAVTVCTPSGLHAAIGERAARAGKHVLVEKPIDVTLEAAGRLIEAASGAGVTLGVVSQHRFDDAMLRVDRARSEGTFGRIVFAAAVVRWWREQSYYAESPWRGSLRLDGGALLNQGVHYVDLLLWLLGPPSRVYARYAKAAHDVEGEDLALVTVEFAGGALATIEVTTAAYPGFPERLTLVGERGTVSVSGSEIEAWELYGSPDSGGPNGSGRETAGPAGAGAAADPTKLAAESHRRQVADFVEAVNTGREPLVTGADGLRALELILAARASSQSGEPVDVTPHAVPA